MAEVTIGGQVRTVTLPNFKKLKAAWKYLSAIQESKDPMDSVDAILGVVSVGSSEPVSVDQLEEELLPSEMATMRDFINDLMIEIGLARREDERPLAEAAAESPSTGATPE